MKKNFDKNYINSQEYWEKILEREGLWDIDKQENFSERVGTILATKIDESQVEIKTWKDTFKIFYKWKLAWVVDYQKVEDWVYVEFLWTPNWTEKTLWHNAVFDNKYIEYFWENRTPIIWMWPYLFEKFFFEMAKKWKKIYWKPIEWSENFYRKCFNKMADIWALEYIFEDWKYEITPL